MNNDGIFPVDGGDPRRVLIIATNHTYRAQAFLGAAEALGIELVQAVDMPRALAEQWDLELGLDFTDLDDAVARIGRFAEERPLAAILAVDDSGSLLAARASAALGLKHNSVAAAEAARDKQLMRQLLRNADVPAPHFQRFHTSESLDIVAAQVTYPCVVKPLHLSGSKGVIRANDDSELAAAAARLEKILDNLEPGPHFFLVEQFIPGKEVALEGLLEAGDLTVLALFDKPDPLEGPYFEETIYVTPSRLPQSTQRAISDCAARAAAALGLRTGPMHAELRVNEDGPWILEVAARSIGGLCSQALRFGTNAPLEELILRQACGMNIESTEREGEASGVMMIPIPGSGLLRGVHGCEAAEAVPLIQRVEVTAKLNYPVIPLPEGDSYLGFIFARGESPEHVEAALREAHSRLHFEIVPHITLTPVRRDA